MAINEYGLDVPADSDEFDPSGDLRALGDSLADSILVPVVNDTARDALTLFDGLVVNRLDTGNIERYDGTDWNVFTPHTDTDWKATGHGVTVASGWTLNTINVRVLGPQVFVVAEVKRTGGTLSASTYGDLPNTAVLNLPTELTPSTNNSSFSSFSAGLLYSFAAYSSGTIVLLAGPPGADVINTQTVSFSGSYLL